MYDRLSYTLLLTKIKYPVRFLSKMRHTNHDNTLHPFVALARKAVPKKQLFPPSCILGMTIESLHNRDNFALVHLHSLFHVALGNTGGLSAGFSFRLHTLARPGMKNKLTGKRKNYLISICCVVVDIADSATIRPHSFPLPLSTYQSSHICDGTRVAKSRNQSGKSSNRSNVRRPRIHTKICSIPPGAGGRMVILLFRLFRPIPCLPVPAVLLPLLNPPIGFSVLFACLEQCFLVPRFNI